MKILSSTILSFIFIVFWSCSDSGEPKLEGCTDSNACNYSAENTHDDGSCEFSEENFDCDGNCTISIDCADECGGDAVEDVCGECSGDGTACENQVPGCMDVTACNHNSDATFNNGSCAFGVDCLGECGGDAVVDDCEVCGGDNSTCVNYSTDIQPIFNAHCTYCHGVSGGLTLTSYSDLMENDVVEPTNSTASKLIQKLRGTLGTQMPKNQDPLDETTINLIETWIDEGALHN